MNKVTLVLDKKKIEFHLGLGFLGELLEEQNADFKDFMSKIDSNPFKMYPILMESSARYALYRKGKEPKYTLNDFIDMIDEVGLNSKEVTRFNSALLNAINKDVPLEPESEVNETAGK